MHISHKTQGGADGEKTRGAGAAGTKTNPLLVYIFVVCAGLALGNYAYNYYGPREESLSRETEIVLTQTTPQIHPAPAKKTIPPAPIAKSAFADKEEFVLNGVFFEQGKSYALINNKIVVTGDMIEGAKVKRIGIDAAEIEFKGKTIKLLSPS
ncbi:MAG: hypothetical protein V1869_01555 [Candidatus Omnitrophota bacterium]